MILQALDLNKKSAATNITEFKQGTGAEIRLAAALAVLDVLVGRSLSVSLSYRTAKFTDNRDVALTSEIAYGVLRILPQLQSSAANFLTYSLKPKDLDVECLILVGIYQLSALRIPHYAAVSETVAAAKLLGKPWASGLVNAVLRSLQRHLKAQPPAVNAENTESKPSHCFPEWLATRLQQAWPENAAKIMHASNQHPPMTVRVNLARTTLQEYINQLISAGITVRPVPHAVAALILDTPIDITALPGFADGLVSIQDAAAQLAAPLLEVKPNNKVLDVCAAPGGKTSHILEIWPDIELTAIDIDPERLQILRQNLTRLRQTAKIMIMDLTSPTAIDSYYDRILCDVPCTATGIIRRHPDIKWLRRSTDIAPLIATQAKILDIAWQKLKPGGILLYVTCSILPEENTQQILAFLQRTKDASELPIDAAWGNALIAGRQILTGENNMDGFYFAKLMRSYPNN